MSKKFIWSITFVIILVAAIAIVSFVYLTKNNPSSELTNLPDNDLEESNARSVDLSSCINLKTPSNLEYYKSQDGAYGEQYRYDAYGRGIFCPPKYVLVSTTPSLCPESNPYLGETLIYGSSSDPKSKGYYGDKLGKTLAIEYYNENNPSIIYFGIQYSCLSRDYALDTKRVAAKEVEAVCCRSE